MQKIYLVCQEDRGLGTIIMRAYHSRKAAEKCCSEIGGDYIEEVELEE